MAVKVKIDEYLNEIQSLTSALDKNPETLKNILRLYKTV